MERKTIATTVRRTATTIPTDNNNRLRPFRQIEAIIAQRRPFGRHDAISHREGSTQLCHPRTPNCGEVSREDIAFTGYSFGVVQHCNKSAARLGTQTCCTDSIAVFTAIPCRPGILVYHTVPPFVLVFARGLTG